MKHQKYKAPVWGFCYSIIFSYLSTNIKLQFYNLG
jgi:hypothetical protein